ncbi:membrane progesterone receptor epsilon-like [Acipenser oxyrinchus oxyrinchus]|uniref:Membrane progesterone receptor epsilon-like n=1 Tax=Acipenser oxyrinchus oxyrinchus TaxID=40147 RepID=A0AAD8CN38_ACIOX|nr:membrane progesterone receptor epsilon-like [Acipenser oxyrinchus oxyrinchus]
MPLRRKTSHLLLHTQVPARVTESFILSGYRSPDYSFLECLLSAFQPTNETGNFWTHFLAVFVFALSFLELFITRESTPSFSDPFFYPLWNYVIGVLGLLLASSMAHLFNSMSLLVREICFFVDYGTISAYTVGSSLAYFYYIHPQTAAAHPPGNFSTDPWLLRQPLCGVGCFDTLYIPSACLVAVICTLACCCTRRRWRRYRYVIRTFVFLLPFTVASAPIFYRLYAGGPLNGTLAPFFYRHCFWLLASAVFNVSKIPERFSPGKFDIWGHSHQWFHCCTFMSILDELRMIKGEIRWLSAVTDQAAELPLAAATLCSTYGVMFGVQCCIGGIISAFAVRASGDHSERAVDVNQRKCS